MCSLSPRTCVANRLNGHFRIRAELYQKASSYRARSAQATLAVNNNIAPSPQQSKETGFYGCPQSFKTLVRYALVWDRQLVPLNTQL